MTKACRCIGFLLSGVLHLGAAAALTPMLTQHEPYTSVEELPITLAMFRQSPPKTIQTAIPPSPAVKETPPKVLPKKRPPVSRPEREAKAKPGQDNPPIDRRRPLLPPKPRATKTNENTAAEPPTQRSDKVTAADPQKIAVNVPEKAIELPLKNAVNTAQVDRIKTRYLSELHKRIQRHKFYPREARRRRITGNVSVAFIIDKVGQISNIRIQRSSGFDLLDDAAEKTLKNIRGLHPLPEQLGVETWELVVPMSYRLRR